MVLRSIISINLLCVLEKKGGACVSTLLLVDMSAVCVRARRMQPYQSVSRRVREGVLARGQSICALALGSWRPPSAAGSSSHLSISCPPSPCLRLSVFGAAVLLSSSWSVASCVAGSLAHTAALRRSAEAQPRSQRTHRQTPALLLRCAVVVLALPALRSPPASLSVRGESRAARNAQGYHAGPGGFQGNRYAHMERLGCSRQRVARTCIIVHAFSNTCTYRTFIALWESKLRSVCT
jgi:hypothetical protein